MLISPRTHQDRSLIHHSSRRSHYIHHIFDRSTYNLHSKHMKIAGLNIHLLV